MRNIKIKKIYKKSEISRDKVFYKTLIIANI